MTLVDQSLLILAVLIWFAAALSWFYGVIELVAVQLVKPWAFRSGRLVVEEIVPSRPPEGAGSSSRVVKTVRGKARFLSDKDCFFCEKFIRRPFAWYTPFAIKGHIVWRGEEALIEGRLPVGSSLFFICAPLFCTAVAVLIFIQVPATSTSLLTVLVALGMWLFCAAIYRFSVSFEKKRILEVAGELLGRQAADAA